MALPLTASKTRKVKKLRLPVKILIRFLKEFPKKITWVGLSNYQHPSTLTLPNMNVTLVVYAFRSSMSTWWLGKTTVPVSFLSSHSVINFITKCSFHSESAISFSNLQISKRKYYPITILSLKLEFAVYYYYRKFRF